MIKETINKKFILKNISFDFWLNNDYTTLYKKLLVLFV